LGKQSRLYDFNCRSLQEVEAINNEEEKIVKNLIYSIRGHSDYLEREQALKRLILEVRDGRYDIEVLAKVIKRGGLILELDAIVKQTRWLKAQKISFADSLASKGQTSQK